MLQEILTFTYKLQQEVWKTTVIEQTYKKCIFTLSSCSEKENPATYRFGITR